MVQRPIRNHFQPIWQRVVQSVRGKEGLVLLADALYIFEARDVSRYWQVDIGCVCSISVSVLGSGLRRWKLDLTGYGARLLDYSKCCIL